MTRRSHSVLLESDLLNQEWELKAVHEDFFFPGPEDFISLVIQNEDGDEDEEEIEVKVDLFDGDKTHDHIKQTLKINPVSSSVRSKPRFLPSM